VDNAALEAWLDADARRWAALDCWEGEPAPRASLMRHPQLAIGTPHIAGHSLDGKANNTLFACRALCRWLGVPAVWNPDDWLPTPEPVTVQACGDPWRTLHRAARALFPLMRDHEAMRGWADKPDAERAAAFRGWRRHYPVRRSWKKVHIRLADADTSTQRLAQQMNMRLSTQPPRSLPST